MNRKIALLLWLINISFLASAQKTASGTYLMTGMYSEKGEKIAFDYNLFTTILRTGRTMVFWDFTSATGNVEGAFRIEQDSTGSTNMPIIFEKIDKKSFNKKWYNNKYQNMPMDTWIIEKNESHEPSEFMKGIKKTLNNSLLFELVGKIEKSDIPKITPVKVHWRYILVGDYGAYSIKSDNTIDNEYQTYSIKELPRIFSSTVCAFIIDNKVYEGEYLDKDILQLTTVHDGVPVTFIYKLIDTPKYLIDAFNKL